MPRPTDDQTDGPVTTGGPGDEPGAPGPGPIGDDALASIEEVMRRDVAGASGDADDELDVELGEVIVADDDPVRAAQGERDEYRDALQRLKAEFDNYRKRTAKAEAETRERASEALVVSLLPVLDACDAAVVHDADDVGPISKMLLETLAKQGLEPMVVEGQPFDPQLHEAVLHEPAEGDESIVIESLRTGYLWKGRVLRPAMVKVKG
ncbi:MAG TPA: nucleotide exchange factor GrpE [Acidimicrobiales bacterium]|nr:nucleotide exchange factor GrpE [Acidimicrobiales bacterium]